MLRFFRTRAPLFGLLLIAALLVTLPGIRHPLPMIALIIFTALAWRALARWRARPAEERSLDDTVSQSADAWDARHGPPDEALSSSESEAWRASLGAPEAWRGSDEEDER
jgi:hypothetical protein